MKILLHTCCAPCATYVLQVLAAEGHEVTAYFYNPNIHPAEEYERRRATLQDFAIRIGLPILEDSYDPQQYFAAIGQETEKPGRCRHCYRLRLERTAAKAQALGYEGFTTTLLISPYQDEEILGQIGQELAERYALQFYYADFKAGYWQSRMLAKESGLYRQKYCGCTFSLSGS
ncbi:MAG: epoxyqueuosine reductase QueH [Chloroflexi bacterium]|nr:epoxyqueuosine reductase QueH [Chloroflexota bacterium]MCL5075134.1 epoxyqueuosine reductase QueH [Chloroflexota bacterium]